jgi:hypothetical protein
MKHGTMMMALLSVSILWVSAPLRAVADSAEKIKEGTREAVTEVRKEAVQAGKAAAETSREIKEGAVKTGEAIKESAKEVGRGIKKAYQETRDAVTKEFSGNTRETTGH